MKHRFFFVFLLAVTLGAMQAQVNIKTDIPSEIKANTEVTVEVKINKGLIKNYSKYQMEVPQGITVKELDNNSGTFSFENGIAKIIWAITPADAEFGIKLVLTAEGVSGQKSIIQKYHYLEKGEKREIEISPIVITVVDGSALASSPDSTAKIGEGEDVKTQVSNLKKDSREAFEIGEKEKKIAEANLAEANAAITKANGIKNEKEKQEALSLAKEAKAKAESDLEVALRIISLAKALDENAKEIEQLNQPLEVDEAVDPSLAATEAALKASGATTKTTATSPAKIEKAKQDAITKGAKEAKGMYKPIKPGNQNISEIKQQVDQIRIDANDAYEVGTREKKKAETKLNEAYQAAKTAEEITDPVQRDLAVEKASRDKQRAEKDLELASKILTLAKSLEENAKEIEKLNLSQGIVASTGNSTVASPVVSDQPTQPASGESQPAKTQPKVEPVVKKQVVENNNAVSNKIKESGTVYKVQIGACVNPPDRSVYVPLGKVEVITEDGKYKVYVGSYTNREEAVKRKEEIIAKGFDGFIVSFMDGVRQK